MDAEDQLVEIGARALFGTFVTNVTFEESHGRDELRKQSRAYLAAYRDAGLVVVPRETFDDLRHALEAFVEHEVDYMARNNLGDPEKQGRVIYARNALAAAASLPTPPATGGEDG